MSEAYKVSVSEFERRASAALRRARRGEAVEITSRGESVAILIPTGRLGPHDRAALEQQTGNPRLRRIAEHDDGDELFGVDDAAWEASG